jgi:hypothetical protein
MFTATTTNGLEGRADAVAYRLEPVKGARVAGRVLVGMTTHTAKDYRNGGCRPAEITCPAMWVDLTPALARDTGNGNGTGVGKDRELLLTVNGREYGAEFAISARVELEPRQEHLDKYYPTLTVEGTDYHVKASFNQWDKVTDAFRKVVGATMVAIALEYITDARWHALRVANARRRVEYAQRDADDANSKLAAAQAELVSLE